MDTNHQHRLRFIESSKVHKKGHSYRIDKYQCTVCNKWYFIDKCTNKRISFGGGLGEEL